MTETPSSIPGETTAPGVPKELEKFNKLARAFPVTKLAAELKHTPPAIYSWLNGRCRPKMSTAWQIVKIFNGELTLADVRPDTAAPIDS